MYIIYIIIIIKIIIPILSALQSTGLYAIFSLCIRYVKFIELERKNFSLDL